MNLQDINKKEEELINTLEQIENALSPETAPSPEDIEGIIGSGIEIANLSANSARCLADAKQILLHRELLFMKANENLWDKPTILKKLMDGTLSEQHKNVIWADRINAAIGHKLDFYRSIVSKYKEEMKLSQMQQINNRG